MDFYCGVKVKKNTYFLKRNLADAKKIMNPFSKIKKNVRGRLFFLLNVE